jgi:hypothetical protein
MAHAEGDEPGHRPEYERGATEPPGTVAPYRRAHSPRPARTVSVEAHTMLWVILVRPVRAPMNGPAAGPATVAAGRMNQGS